MALAELIGKLKNKKQTATKTAFSHSRDVVRKLASGEEIDADEVGHILEAAGLDESFLEDAVELQQKRFERHAQRLQNQQAVSDRLQAESDLQAAQRALQAAYDKLFPAIEQAQVRLNDANHRFMTTTQAEAWLADPENILDKELLQREAAVIAQLREVNNELKPLLQDQARKQTFLSNLEDRLAELRKAASVPWLPLPVTTPWLGRVNGDIRTIESRISDVRSELQQLDRAIQPRRIEQSRLQAELNQIHHQKLLP